MFGSSTSRTIRRLGLRQTIKGAIIFGLIAGTMVSIQGFAYVKAYSTTAQREQFVYTLKSSPALGIMYGESSELKANAPETYMAYRSLVFMSLVGAIWALMVSTRLLRGNEEEGRWEVVLSGTASPQAAAFNMMIGFARSLLVGALISLSIIFAVTRMPDFDVSLLSVVLLNIAMFAPAALFAGAGVLVSQLAITRRRALTYGLSAIAVLFIVRAVGNTISSWYWLKIISPFGWVDRLSPMTAQRWQWLLAFAAMFLLCIVYGIFLAGQRDLDASILHESDQRKPRYYLLANEWQLVLRRNLGVYGIWAICVVFMGGLMTMLASLAVKATASSSQLNSTLAQLTGGSPDKLKLAFIGSGMLFTTFILLLMTINGVGDAYREELRNRANMSLVSPLSRSRWLISHMAVVATVVAIISIITSGVVWILASRQNLGLSLTTILGGAAQAYGSILFVLGCGVLLYGVVPRLTVPLLYAILLWSFMIDIVASVAHLSKVVTNSSLFHYISLMPATNPNWPAFAWLTASGIALFVLGTIGFTHRDLVSD